MARYRRHALIVIAVVAAIITPPDLFTLFLVSLPMYGLYEISILIVRRVDAKRQLSEKQSYREDNI